MVSKEIGIRGYIGEEIARIWLMKKYPSSEGYEVINQIMPVGIEKRGGPYLDLAVVKDNKVYAIYEVKTQDYPTLGLNKALVFFWENQGKTIICESQDRRRFETLESTKAYLILLVAPKTMYFKEEIEAPAESVIMFNEIIKQINDSDKETIIEELKKSVDKELNENWKNLLNESKKNVEKLREKGKIAKIS